MPSLFCPWRLQLSVFLFVRSVFFGAYSVLLAWYLVGNRPGLSHIVPSHSSPLTCCLHSSSVILSGSVRCRSKLAVVAHIACHIAPSPLPPQEGRECLPAMCYMWLDVCVAFILLYNNFSNSYAWNAPVAAWLIAR